MTLAGGGMRLYCLLSTEPPVLSIATTTNVQPNTREWQGADVLRNAGIEN